MQPSHDSHFVCRLSGVGLDFTSEEIRRQAGVSKANGCGLPQTMAKPLTATVRLLLEDRRPTMKWREGLTMNSEGSQAARRFGRPARTNFAFGQKADEHGLLTDAWPKRKT